MEYAEKSYSTVGEGMLKLVDNVWSFSQAFAVEKICRCESCLESNGEEWIVSKEKEREEKLIELTFGSVEELLESVVPPEEEEVDYGNYVYTGVEDGNQYIIYQTGGGLRLCITRISDNEYFFTVTPPNEYFRGGSSLIEALEAIGYKSVLTKDCKKGETKMHYIKDTWPDGIEVICCAVCNEKIISESGCNLQPIDCCPRCERRIDKFPTALA